MQAAAGSCQWTLERHLLESGVDRLGTGPPVLMLPAPSSICTRAELRPLADRLADSFGLVIPDWPGFGEGPAPAVRWTPDHLRRFLVGFARDAMAGPFAIVAAGHAAAYALDLAVTTPGAVSRIALVAPTWRGPLPTVAQGYRPWQGRVRAAVEATGIGPAVYRLNVSAPVLRMMMKGHVLADPAHLTAELLGRKAAITRRRNARFATAAFVTGGLDLVRSRAAFLDLVRRAGVPILAVWGPQTPPRSRTEMEALADLEGVRVAAVPAGALGVHEEFPAEVAAVVRPFLLAER